MGTSRKLLKKTTIPAVKTKEDIIKLPLEEDFRKVEGIVHLEKLRKGVRELVKYIDPVDQRYVTTDFVDYILEDKIVSGGMANEADPEYPQSPFQNNVHRLEELIRVNENHITISRIRKRRIASFGGYSFYWRYRKRNYRKRISYSIQSSKIYYFLNGLKF